jgi:hypothetical protein
MKAGSDLMDIDEGHNPTEEGTLFVQSQSADKNETRWKRREHVEESIAHAQTSESADPTFTPESIMDALKQGGRHSPVDLSEDDVDDELLVGMKKLSTVDHSDGVPDAFCRAGRTKMLIVRYGPPRAATYVIQPGVGYNTDGLQDVSDAESRLCDIMVRDPSGVKRRRYGLENIVGIVGVAIMDLPPDSTSSKPPTTYVKFRWRNIAEEHQHLLDKNGDNWNRRTDLKNYTGEKMAFSKLEEAWMKQEERYNKWKRRREVGTVERSPTPFPLDVYRRRREESRGPLKVRRGTTIKREETPRASTEATEPATPRPGTTIKREETPRASTEATEAATTPKPPMVTNRPGATSSSENKARKRQEARFNDWERGHPFAWRYQTINVMKFPREVIDRISSFLPPRSRVAFLSSLNLQPWESDRQRMLLWSTIFKNDQWLAEVTEKDTAELVLIGSQLREVSSREREQGRKEYFMTLCLLGGTGKIPTWELFESSLHEHTYDRSSDEIRFASGITLNVQNLSESYLSVLQNDPEVRQTPCLIISNEGIRRIISFRRGKPYVQYSFYGGSCIQDLSFSNMTEVGGVLWQLKLHDNGVRWTVILASMFYGFRHQLAV